MIRYVIQIALINLYCLSLGAVTAQIDNVTRISLKQAIEMAVSPSALPIQSAQNSTEGSRHRVQEVRAETSLGVWAGAEARSLRVDLRTLGINLPKYPLTNPIQFVGISGPFGVVNPEIKAIKILINKHTKRKLLTVKAGVSESESLFQEERQRIAAGAARQYFKVLRTSQQVELQKRNLEKSELMLRFAEAQSAQGTISAVELRSAKSDMNSERRKLSEFSLEQTRELMTFMYLLGIGFGDTVELTDSFEKHEVTTTLNDAIAYALQHNPKLMTSGIHDKVLAFTESEIRAQALPVLSASAKVGFNIVSPSPSSDSFFNTSFTYTGILELTFPLLDHHRRALEQANLAVQVHEHSLQERELRRQIELETRLAYASLQNATEQLTLAENNLEIAQLDLKEITEERTSGNVSRIEVQQSEVRRAVAEDAKLAALYTQAQARLSLAEVEGQVLSMEW